MSLLCIIPARRDSKGLPGKNWKPLNNKPLISYSIEIAQAFQQISQICISTNSEEVVNIAQNQHHLEVPFLRPEELSQDNTSSRDVILHAVNHYQQKGIEFTDILLLQPTSPFRKIEHLNEAWKLYQQSDCEMVTSVYTSPFNPYYNIFLESEQGYIQRSIPSTYTRRQDCPPAYVLNGSIYFFKVDSILKHDMSEFAKICKYQMDESYSIDIDTEWDWAMAEKYIQSGLMK